MQAAYIYLNSISYRKQYVHLVSRNLLVPKKLRLHGIKLEKRKYSFRRIPFLLRKKSTLQFTTHLRMITGKFHHEERF